MSCKCKNMSQEQMDNVECSCSPSRGLATLSLARRERLPSLSLNPSLKVKQAHKYTLPVRNQTTSPQQIRCSILPLQARHRPTSTVLCSPVSYKEGNILPGEHRTLEHRHAPAATANWFILFWWWGGQQCCSRRRRLSLKCHTFNNVKTFE